MTIERDTKRINKLATQYQKLIIDKNNAIQEGNFDSTKTVIDAQIEFLKKMDRRLAKIQHLVKKGDDKAIKRIIKAYKPHLAKRPGFVYRFTPFYKSDYLMDTLYLQKEKLRKEKDITKHITQEFKIMNELWTEIRQAILPFYKRSKIRSRFIYAMLLTSFTFLSIGGLYHYDKNQKLKQWNEQVIAAHVFSNLSEEILEIDKFDDVEEAEADFEEHFGVNIAGDLHKETLAYLSFLAQNYYQNNKILQTLKVKNIIIIESPEKAKQLGGFVDVESNDLTLNTRTISYEIIIHEIAHNRHMSLPNKKEFEKAFKETGKGGFLTNYQKSSSHLLEEQVACTVEVIGYNAFSHRLQGKNSTLYEIVDSLNRTDKDAEIIKNRLDILHEFGFFPSWMVLK